MKLQYFVVQAIFIGLWALTSIPARTYCSPPVWTTPSGMCWWHCSVLTVWPHFWHYYEYNFCDMHIFKHFLIQCFGSGSALILVGWLRIQGGQKWPTKIDVKTFNVFTGKCWCLLLIAKGCSCSVNVLGIEINKFQFQVKKYDFFQLYKFTVLVIKPSTRIRFHLKC
jgi:hypothetical protein